MLNLVNFSIEILICIFINCKIIYGWTHQDLYLIKHFLFSSFCIQIRPDILNSIKNKINKLEFKFHAKLQ